MSLEFDSRYACHPEDFKLYGTQRIRRDFLIEQVMVKNKILLSYIHYDRYIAGGAMPVDGDLSLDVIDPLKADFFLQRRELGIINTGGKGQVRADGKEYTLDYKEALYLGRGTKKITFTSLDKSAPSKFYINSAPAHKTYPNVKIDHRNAVVVEAGSPENANARSIIKLVEASIIDVCQLQMGITELKPGSVWNTMPCHTHDRRMEVYYYFDVDKEAAICHFMGQPDETRHIWMSNEQAVISPPWSIHSGSGTGKYSFVWGMAGENLDYTDMDFCRPLDLR